MITHLHFKPIVQRWEWSNYQVFLNQVVKHNLWSNISASHDVCLFCMYITIYCDMPITLIVRQIKHQQNYKCVSALLILTQTYVLFWFTDFLSFIDVGLVWFCQHVLQNTMLGSLSLARITVLMLFTQGEKLSKGITLLLSIEFRISFSETSLWLVTIPLVSKVRSFNKTILKVRLFTYDPFY